MAFFYGLEFIFVIIGSDYYDEAEYIGNDAPTILPGMHHVPPSFLYVADLICKGHHFKDGFAAGILAIIVVTWFALALLYRLNFRLKLSPTTVMRRRQKRAWTRKWNPTALSLPTIVVFTV
jgi:hypothetical protein